MMKDDKNRNRRILLVVSTARRHENSLQAAVRRAIENDDRVAVLLVADTERAADAVRKGIDSGWLGAQTSADLYQSVLTESLKAGEQLLADMKRIFSEKGIAVDTMIRTGPFVDTTLAVLGEERFDLVILPRRKRLRLSRFFFGSSVAQIRARTKVPVLMVDEEE